MTHSGLADPFITKSLNFSWWVDTILRAKLVIPRVDAHVFVAGTPNWALMVKTTVPTSCTPPFSGNSQQWSALKGSRSVARERG